MERAAVNVRIFLLPALALALCACREQSLDLHLRHDGSGTVTAGVYLRQTQDPGPAETWPTALRQELDLAMGALRDSLRGPLRENGVRYHLNAQGWPGVERVWTFADLNQISISGGQGDQFGFTFRMSPGKEAQVRVDPVYPRAEALRQSPVFDARMADQLVPLLEGSRSRIRLQTATQVLDHRAAPAAGLDEIILLDVLPAKCMGYASVLELLREGREETLRGLAALGREGLLLPKPDTPVVFRF